MPGSLSRRGGKLVGHGRKAEHAAACARSLLVLTAVAMGLRRRMVHGVMGHAVVVSVIDRVVNMTARREMQLRIARLRRRSVMLPREAGQPRHRAGKSHRQWRADHAGGI